GSHDAVRHQCVANGNKERHCRPDTRERKWKQACTSHARTRVVQPKRKDKHQHCEKAPAQQCHRSCNRKGKVETLETVQKPDKTERTCYGKQRHQGRTNRSRLSRNQCCAHIDTLPGSANPLRVVLPVSRSN